MERRPNFFIVGAPKCGTTFLYESLRAHPQVFMPAVKEIHFHGADIRMPGLERDLATYLALFDGWTDEPRAGEDSTWYLYSKEAAREIKAFSPDADIFILVRNPVDLLYAHYSQIIWNREMVPGGVIEGDGQRILSIEEAIANQDERRAAFRADPDERTRRGKRVYRSFHVDEALLADGVQRYLDAFGPEHVHVIVYDDLKADSAAVYEGALRFLGVDPTFKPELKPTNVNRQIKNQRMHHLLTNWRSTSVLRKTLRAIVPTRLRKQAFQKLMDANVERTKRPPLQPETRAQLEAYYRPDVEKLSAILGRDLVALWFGTNSATSTSTVNEVAA